MLLIDLILLLFVKFSQNKKMIDLAIALLFTFLKNQSRQNCLGKMSCLMIADEKDPKKYILIKGASVHNLKKLLMYLFRKNKLVVITGMSGSGKSSLAFDTLYAEGQRRICRKLVFLRPSVFGKNE
jgi:predicted ribonuclease YlaK